VASHPEDNANARSRGQCKKGLVMSALARLASSVVALSLLGGLASARTYNYEDDLVVHRFAQPPAPAVERTDAPAIRGDLTPDDMAPTRAQVRAALASRRAQNLAFFRAYKDGGVYPHNFVSAGKKNVWLDEEGRLCAAATIISNWDYDLAMSVPDSNNFLRLRDVTEGPLMDWMLTSGLTQEEIDQIQEPFMGRMEPMPVDQGGMVIAPVKVDPERAAEDARLAKRYAQVDKLLVKGKKKALDLATDRLMANPDLARLLVDSVDAEATL
jgi:hypothetical protein